MNSKKLGILYIISAAFFFALMNLFVRLAGELPFYEKSFFRNLVAILISFITIIRSKEGFHVGEGNMKYIFCRAVCGTIGIFCNFYAIDMLDISDASMLNKLSPFFSTLFSIWILSEKPKLQDIAILAVAFSGALFIVKPSFNIACLPAVIGFVGGMFAGLAYTFIRKLGLRGEKGSNIVFFFSCFSTIVTLPFMILAYKPISTYQLVMLLLAGAAATGGQFSITAAYQHAPAKEISVFDYSQVVFAAILGFLFLGQLADVYSYIGYTIIIAIAAVKWYLNNHKAEE
ncbi:MAG: DMT family transporter [Clostridiales bacterium]|nr:DMT family transporter [Clostridiales bacterium]